MVKVLIPTKPNDADAVYVKLAMKKKGHECTLFYTADFPVQQTHTFEVQDNAVHWIACGPDFCVEKDDEFDVVWVRRPRLSKVPEIIHEEDVENAENEYTSFYKTFWQVLAPHAFWINPVHAATSANCKLLQLKIAMQIGFNVPVSIFSNDPERIKKFIRIHHDSGVIYKTLFPVAWIKKDELRLGYTEEIKIENLPSDAILKCTPGIFQRKIKKKFELRVTCFGAHIVAVKIRSQEHPRGIMDWRYLPHQEVKVEKYELPEEIADKCRLLMKRFGLVMGCFDFIVTPDGDYYFLEINEQGQFLWIEELNPDIKLLDAFTDFLISRSASFEWAQPKNSLSLLDLKNDMIPIQKHAMATHVEPGKF